MLEGCQFTPEQINQAACSIAQQGKTHIFCPRSLPWPATIYVSRGTWLKPLHERWPERREHWWREESPRQRLTPTKRLDNDHGRCSIDILIYWYAPTKSLAYINLTRHIWTMTMVGGLLIYRYTDVLICTSHLPRGWHIWTMIIDHGQWYNDLLIYWSAKSYTYL